MIVEQDRESQTIRNVNFLSEVKLHDIEFFLQGAVYCWCKNRPDEWFGLRDLMGGENFNWEGTPLYALWEHYNENGTEDPVLQAGVSGGHILKKVIKSDDRDFYTKKEENYPNVRLYKWKN